MKIDHNGYLRRTYEEYLALYKESVKSSLGQDISLLEDGVLLRILQVKAKKMSELEKRNEAQFYSRHPWYMEGVPLSSFLARFGVQRVEATFTSVSVVIQGSSRVYLSVDVPFVDLYGREWFLLQPLSLSGFSDSATIFCFSEIEVGVTEGDVFTVDVDDVSSVVASFASIDGVPEELDSVLFSRFLSLLRDPSSSSYDDAKLSVEGVDGVNRVFLEVNRTPEHNGSLPSNSGRFYVDGGSDEDIAKALSDVVPRGSLLFGDYEVSVLQSNGEYRVLPFSRFSILSFWVRVTLSINSLFPENTGEGLLKQCLVDYVDGLLPGDCVESFYMATSINVDGVDDLNLDFSVGDEVSPGVYDDGSFCLERYQYLSLTLDRVEVLYV